MNITYQQTDDKKNCLTIWHLQIYSNGKAKKIILKSSIQLENIFVSSKEIGNFKLLQRTTAPTGNRVVKKTYSPKVSKFSTYISEYCYVTFSTSFGLLTYVNKTVHRRHHYSRDNVFKLSAKNEINDIITIKQFCECDFYTSV